MNNLIGEGLDNMVEEQRIITASNGGKYLIVKEIDKDEEGKYFFALGVTKDYEIDYDNTIIFKAEKEGDQEFVTALDPESPEYEELMSVYFLKIMCEYVPGAKQEAERIIKQLAEEESSI